VDCLGPQGGLVENRLYGENDASWVLCTEPGEVCANRVAFRRGDPNEDGRSNLGDVLRILICVFRDEECPRCYDSADANDDDDLDVADPVYLLWWRFVDGPPPLAPFTACGVDPTDEDSLGCAGYEPCDDC
jgi:hypothetical protein